MVFIVVIGLLVFHKVLSWDHFILYINELTSLGKEFGITIYSYADDTTLYIGLNPKLEFYTVVEKLKTCLHKINVWMSKNFLKLNVNKTQLLACGKNDYQTLINHIFLI